MLPHSFGTIFFDPTNFRSEKVTFSAFFRSKQTGTKKRIKGTLASPLSIGDATRFARAYEKAFKVLSD